MTLALELHCGWLDMEVKLYSVSAPFIGCGALSSLQLLVHYPGLLFMMLSSLLVENRLSTNRQSDQKYLWSSNEFANFIAWFRSKEARKYIETSSDVPVISTDMV